MFKKLAQWEYTVRVNAETSTRSSESPPIVLWGLSLLFFREFLNLKI